MQRLITTLTFLIFSSSMINAEPSISPSLFFQRNSSSKEAFKNTVDSNDNWTAVTVRFRNTPDKSLLSELETSGLLFTRLDGDIVHSRHVYCANACLDSLERLMRFKKLLRIEASSKPSVLSTLEISAPQVQASNVWNNSHTSIPLDGSGVTVVNVDTGIDIYHPGFFRADGETYNWIDFNGNGIFDKNIDFVDLNRNGKRDNNEILSFFDSYFSDPLELVSRNAGIYDADIDWLYNDANTNFERDYGLENGFGENDPCFGEMIFVTNDFNGNNLLDTGETITALNSSKIKAVYDANGPHIRGENLFSVVGDVNNHGTGSSGIIGGQIPGRRFTGMAPGVDFVVIDRADVNLEEAIFWATRFDPDIYLYEFASFVFEFLDGTSNLEIFINDLFDEGYLQFTASGNLAGPARKKHARINPGRSETETIEFNVPDIGVNFVFLSLIWQERFLSPTLTLTTPDGLYVVINGDQQEHKASDLIVLSGKDISSKNTNRMDLIISSEKSFSGDFSVSVSNRRSSSIAVDAYISDNITHWMNGTQFTSHVTDDGTICSPGTAEKDLTVGAYDPRGTRNTKGDINDFSSWGLTMDGRRAVDICAPGTLVYSLNSHYAIGGDPGAYIDFGGTSAALPHVAGCAALIKQLHPDYSPDMVNQIIIDGALQDSFTGDVPNSIWGYGKLRIYDSFVTNGDFLPLYTETQTPLSFNVSQAYPNPFNSTISFDLQLNEFTGSSITYEVFNIIGQKIFSRTYTPQSSAFNINWDFNASTLPQTSSGIYFFRFTHHNLSIHRSAIYLK